MADIVLLSHRCASNMPRKFSQETLNCRKGTILDSPPPTPRLEPGNTDLHGARNGVEGEDELDLFIRRVDTLPVGAEPVKCGVPLPLRRAASSASLLSTQNTTS
ncbi:hypothetical protein EDB85DRAFT_2147427 [Lactarius pseudohatsudake]|nr:hypothetical protein EDB85DRAFT_2147427 [Lactarius pseudohatsudake]